VSFHNYSGSPNALDDFKLRLSLQAKHEEHKAKRKPTTFFLHRFCNLFFAET